MVLSVLAVADTVSAPLYDHFCPERWGHIDLVLSAGDLPPEYLDFLCSSLNVPVLYVRGNHDGTFTDVRYAGSEDIHGRMVTVNGLRIAGFEGCHWYNGGKHQYTEEAMARLVRRVDRQVRRDGTPDIVLTHAAPAGCHDAADPCHQGFICFREAIDRWQPAYFIHGHVHAYNGQCSPARVGSTSVINAYPFHVFEVHPPAESSYGVTGSQWWRQARRSIFGQHSAAPSS